MVTQSLKPASSTFLGLSEVHCQHVENPAFGRVSKVTAIFTLSVVLNSVKQILIPMASIAMLIANWYTFQDRIKIATN